jgi:hypothetical protein
MLIITPCVYQHADVCVCVWCADEACQWVYWTALAGVKGRDGEISAGSRLEAAEAGDASAQRSHQCCGRGTFPSFYETRPINLTG